MVKTALIGCGYWGSKLKKYIEANKHFDLVHVCDSKTDMEKVWDDVEAIVVATPIHTHYEVTKQALLNGKHVFCAKPLAKKVKECLELKKLAEKKKLVLCVDYTWTFSKVLKKAQKTDFGEIQYLDIVYTRPKRKGTIENVFWLLGTHALAIASMFPSTKYPGIVLLDSAADVRRTLVSIWGSKRAVRLNLEGDMDNLKYAVDYFYKVLKGKAKTNIDRAIEITRILE